MLTAILDKLTRTPRRALATAAAATVVAALPATAHARHGLHIDVVLPVAPVVVTPAPCAPPPVTATQVWVEPTYRTVFDRQWVEPTYRTVCNRVWVPPVTTTAHQQVFVPDQYGWQTVVDCDAWGRRYRHRAWTVVVPAHYEDRCDSVVVTPGHYEDVQQQQLVCDGHWATVERQELVTPGHWETRVATVDAPPAAEVRFRLPF